MKADFEISNIKVVFMDIGGVLLSNGWGHLSRQKAAAHFGFDLDEMSILHQFIYDVFEVGSITLDDYLDTVLFYKPRDFSKDAFKEFMYSQSTELPEILDWLKQWKKQTDLPVFALSNENKELNDYRIKKFKLNEIFDGFFSSCYLGYRKPDPRIYHKALEITQVKPEQSIYFDDRPMLVHYAEKLGINSFLHKDFETTKNRLQQFKRK